MRGLLFWAEVFHRVLEVALASCCYRCLRFITDSSPMMTLASEVVARVALHVDAADLARALLLLHETLLSTSKNVAPVLGLSIRQQILMARYQLVFGSLIDVDRLRLFVAERLSIAHGVVPDVLIGRAIPIVRHVASSRQLVRVVEVTNGLGCRVEV